MTVFETTGSETRTVLVVAMASSVHTANWLNCVRVPGLRFVLFPVYESPVSSVLADWQEVSSAVELDALARHEVGVFRCGSIADTDIQHSNDAIGYATWLPPFMPPETVFRQPLQLATAIRLLKPDLVHSMEIQMAGYLCLGTRRLLGEEFPRWLLSNWGSDIYLYRKMDEHRHRLAEVASTIDVYQSECRRDIALVRELGFMGECLAPIPASGGMRFNTLPRLDDLPTTSTRREILIKGYHGWSGRSFHVLAALQLAAPSLRGYQIRISLAGSAAHRSAAAALADATGLDVRCYRHLPHKEALDMLGRARVMIGAGISDGISTTLLESMAMGCFPIQSNTSCCDEWFEDGVGGFRFSPHDVAQLAALITCAMSDDGLVDAAARRNRAVVEERWNAEVNGAAMVANYRSLIGVEPA